MKKMMFCLICVLLLSGCSANVDLVVTSNEKLEEKISIWNDWTYLSNYYDSTDEAIESYRQSYSELFKNSNYSVAYRFEDNAIKANIYSSKHNLSNIIHSSAFQQLFKNIEINEASKNKKYTLIYADEVLSLFEDTLGVGGDSEMFFEEIVINIQFHQVVGNNNADHYNDKTNTYTWVVTKDNLNRNIEFQVTNEKRYDIIMSYLMKKYMVYIILGIILICIGVFALVMVYKAKKENEI